MKIGIITMCGARWGGSEELWASTAEKAIGESHEVVVSLFGWTKEPPVLERLTKLGVRFLRRHNPDLSARESFGPASTFRDLFKLHPDVLIINQGGSFDTRWRPELLDLLAVTPKPYIIICHCNEDLPLLAGDRDRQEMKRFYAGAFRVLFVSQQNRKIAERQLASKIPNADLVLNPVNLADRSYLDWLESKTAYFASVARLESHWKGHDVLLEAFSDGRWLQRDWHLTLYGTGQDHNYLQSLIEFYRLGERVTLAGFSGDVRGIWSRNQIAVMFSRAEGTPLALVEAMLCGRPAIVSDVGGNGEWITEGRTGFIADAPVVRQARAALERAWSARDNWHEMGKQAHLDATARFGSANFVALLEVVEQASRRKAVTAKKSIGEREKQTRRYQELLQPPIHKRAKEAAKNCAAQLKERARRCLTNESRRNRSVSLLAEPGKAN
jgi:L-malate glycosyltransferase